MSPRSLWRRATYRARPSFYDEFPLPQDWQPLLTRGGRPGRLWQWVVTTDRRRIVAGGTLVLETDDVQQAAYDAMTSFQAARDLPAHELHGLWCAARKATEPDAIGVVDGRDW